MDSTTTDKETAPGKEYPGHPGRPKDPLIAREVDTLVFSGGGVRGAPLIAGALWRLSQRFPSFSTQGVKEVRGTSVGCIPAVYIACRVNLKSLVEDVAKFDYEPMVQWSALSLAETFGLNDGSKILQHFDAFIHKHTGIKAATFAQLKAWSRVSLILIASNIHARGEEFVMSAETTPHMKVSEAITASVAIPLVFSPRKYGDALLVDGGVVNHFPTAGKAGSCNPERTLAFYCPDSFGASAPLRDMRYLEKLACVILHMLGKSQAANRNEDVSTVVLDVPEEMRGVTVLSWSFTLAQRENLVDAGAKAADAFAERGMIANSRRLVDSATQTSSDPA